MARIPTVFRSKQYEPMVQRLAMQHLNDMKLTIFPTIRELMCFAALLGFAEKRRIKLDEKYDRLGIENVVWENHPNQDIIFLVALADSKDTDILRDGREAECVRIFEEYANGGFEVIQDALLKGGDEFPEKDIIQMLLDQKYLKLDAAESELSGVVF